MKNCKTSARRSVVTPSPCEKNYFLQNKPPAVSCHTEPMRKKLLFAKQTSVTVSPVRGARFTLEDEETVVMFASQAALVIANARRYRGRAASQGRRGGCSSRLPPSA